MESEDMKSMEFLEAVESFAIRLGDEVLEYTKGRELTLKDRFNMWMIKRQLKRCKKNKAKRK